MPETKVAKPPGGVLQIIKSSLCSSGAHKAQGSYTIRDVQDDEDQILRSDGSILFVNDTTLKLTQKVWAEIFEVRSALIQGKQSI